MNEKHSVIIRAAYKDYEPPFDVVATVNRLLNGVPQKRLADLKTVVVASSQNLSKPVRRSKARSRGKSYELGTCRGQYHQKWRSEPAWIELWADNILRHWPRSMLCFSYFRDLAVSDTLFHEIGHHIHHTQVPEFKEKEDVAEQWERRLNRHYYRRRYWYLFPLFLLLWLIVKPFRLLEKKRNRKRKTEQQSVGGGSGKAAADGGPTGAPQH